MVKTTSLFRSTFSSMSMANLSPIHVHMEECGGGGVRVYNQKVGIEEQFAKMSMGQVGQNQEDCGLYGGGGVRVYDQKVGIEEQFAQMSMGQVGQKQEEGGFIILFSPPPMPITIVTFVMHSAVRINPAPSKYPGLVFFNDERSYHGVPIGYHKQPSPQPQILFPPHKNIFIHFPSI